MTYRHLLSLIKKKSVDGETQVSRSRNGTYKPLASYTEFESAFKTAPKKGPMPGEPDYAAWMRQELGKAQKLERRQWLQSLLEHTRGRGRWIALGGAVVGGVVLYMVLFTRTFWRLRRTVHNWFVSPTKKE
jgi:hypothetical protein